MARKKFRIPGVSFSWKRALGVTRAKQRIARATGIPTTREGRRRKFGPFGLWMLGGTTRRATRSDSPFAESSQGGAGNALTGCLVLLAGSMFFCCGCPLLLAPFSATPNPSQYRHNNAPLSLPDSVPVVETQAPSYAARKWYEGGTLHKASAIDWQTADAEDKLATCGDIVAVLWKGKSLKPAIQNRIHSIDDMRPYAEELVVCLDKATEPLSDPAENRRVYVNQTVAGMATIGIVLMGWCETGEASQTAETRAFTSNEPQAEQSSVKERFELSMKQKLEEERRIEEQQRQQQEEARRLAEEQARAAKYREWTDATGKFSVRAAFIKYTAGVVTLEKENGERIDVQADKLSDVDRAWIRAKF